MLQPALSITFYGPYCLDPNSSSFLLGSEPTSWVGGLYVIAWRCAGSDFAHYVGETTRHLYGRVIEAPKRSMLGRLLPVQQAV